MNSPTSRDHFTGGTDPFFNTQEMSKRKVRQQGNVERPLLGLVVRSSCNFQPLFPTTFATATDLLSW